MQVWCMPYDVEMDSQQNVLTDRGVHLFLKLLCKLTPGSVVWMGPPCGSWVWMTRLLV